jgi:hypothetical protein
MGLNVLTGEYYLVKMEIVASKAVCGPIDPGTWKMRVVYFVPTEEQVSIAFLPAASNHSHSEHDQSLQNPTPQENDAPSYGAFLKWSEIAIPRLNLDRKIAELVWHFDHIHDFPKQERFPQETEQTRHDAHWVSRLHMRKVQNHLT